MTRFSLTPPHQPARQPRETVLPMINVVFLLLIFFLMTASIEPSPPFPIDPPRAGGEVAQAAPRVLWVSASGELASISARGEDALAALAAEPGPVLLRADAALPAADLAVLLARLGASGLTEVTLSAAQDGSDTTGGRP